MNVTDTQLDFTAYNAIANLVLVLDKKGRVLFANKAISRVVPGINTELTIFDLLQDPRLTEGLGEYIRQSGEKEYVFTAVIGELTYNFNVTRWNTYYVCNAQSESEIENLYHQQMDSRKKMLDVKEKLLWVSMLDKEDFEYATEQVLRVAANVLDCGRASYWEVVAIPSKIVCNTLYLADKDAVATHYAGTEITREQVPHYFEYITRERAFVLADDIESHPATAEFTEHYSRPLNIKSLLDVPVWHNGKLYGIVCCEQVDKPKKWTLEDVRFALAIADNISMCLQTRDRLQAELKLKAVNMKLHRSNTDLEHFASVAAHDLKSPLRSIVGNLQLFKKQHKGKLGNAELECIDYSMQSATHLTQLINDLLSYSKLEQQISEHVPVDVNKLMQQICMDQQEFIQQQQGKVLLPPNLPVLMLNSNMAYRLFANIMHNAIKYTSGGLTPVLEVSYYADANFHYFEFADNGIGIDDQYAEKIFSLFGRLHGLEQFDGTGIGLATCKKIAELFGGKVLYKRRAQPDGSVFTVMLPLDCSA